MRSKPAIIIVLFALAAGTSVHAQEVVWRLRPGDQILLQVKNEPNLSGRFVVGPEGAIMLPVIGSFDATTASFAAVESRIRTSFARELADPEILVTPLQRVSVTGEVRLPGFQWVDTTSTVGDLLVLAGGLLPTANRKGITLVRDDTEIRVRLKDGGVAEPIDLRSGDRLLVDRRSWLTENLPIFIGAAASVAAAAVTSLIVR